MRNEMVCGSVVVPLLVEKWGLPLIARRIGQGQGKCITFGVPREDPRPFWMWPWGEWSHDGGTEKCYALVRGSEGVGAFGGGRTSECVPDLVRSECPGDG
jgi:hypothetical protein